MIACELQRFAQRKRKTKAVYQPECKGDDPAALKLAADDIFQRHVDDGERDQQLDQRREPQRIGHKAEGGGDQRDGVRDGERRDDHHQRPPAAEGNNQAQQKQQMIDAFQNVPEAGNHEPPCRLMPARIEFDTARIAVKFEGAGFNARRQKAQRGGNLEPQPVDARVDRELRAGGLNRIFQQHVEQLLVPVEIEIVRQRRALDIFQRGFVSGKRRIRRQRHAHLRNARRGQAAGRFRRCRGCRSTRFWRRCAARHPLWTRRGNRGRFWGNPLRAALTSARAPAPATYCRQA